MDAASEGSNLMEKVMHPDVCELMLLTPLMLVLNMLLCLPEFKHRHEEVKADLAAACMILSCLVLLRNCTIVERHPFQKDNYSGDWIKHLKAGSEQEDIRHTIARAGISTWRYICLEDVFLRAAQMEQIVEKFLWCSTHLRDIAILCLFSQVCEERLLILDGRFSCFRDRPALGTVAERMTKKRVGLIKKENNIATLMQTPTTKSIQKMMLTNQKTLNSRKHPEVENNMVYLQFCRAFLVLLVDNKTS
ncbi:hypothetical protein YC2023_113036 [Brassica napus]